MRKYFGTDGVRGLANRELTPELAYALGVAKGHLLMKEREDTPKVIIAQDPRRSSDMFSFALSAGFTSVGCIVEDAYILPTPAISNIIKRGNYQAGAMISASHNPYYDNGIKFFNGKGFKLTDEEEIEIEKLVENIDSIEKPIGEKIGYRVLAQGLEEQYKQSVLQVIHGRDMSGLSIGLDCANGATSFVVPSIFEATKAEFQVIHREPNGININHKSGSTDPASLQALVIENGLDAGFAFDGDGDRLIAVDEKGQVIDGDEILSIIGVWMKNKGILSRNTIVGTVMSNLGLQAMGKREDIQVVNTQVGDRYVLERMVAEGYNLGGEPSGHIIMLDYSNTGDGIIAALVLSRILSETDKTFSELNSFMKRTPQALINVEVDKEKMMQFDKNISFIRILRKSEGELKDKGRILVRASGTEPVIRVLVEGDNEEEINDIANRVAEVVSQEFR